VEQELMTNGVPHLKLETTFEPGTVSNNERDQAVIRFAIAPTDRAMDMTLSQLEEHKKAIADIRYDQTKEKKERKERIRQEKYEKE